MATLLSASGINALFTTLESTRVAHAAGPTQNSSSLGTSFNGYKVSTGQLAQPVTINNIKSCLTTLATSRYMGGTNYGTSITTPARGALIAESLFNTSRTQVDAAAAVCVHDSAYYNGNRSSYNSSYDSSYRGSYRSSYDSANYPSDYRSYYPQNQNSYRAGYQSSYQDVQSSYRYNKTSDYGTNGLCCTAV